MQYTETQIKGAYLSAEANGYACPNRETAIKFLDWYFAHKTEYNSELQAIAAGLLNLDTTGTEQQLAFWQEHGHKLVSKPQ